MTASVTLKNPMSLPLTGSSLIEASAGTGKTYTIAAAYVRFIIAHVPNRQGTELQREALLPPDILVVTFTKAATAELKERIRARLVEAAKWFRETTSAKHKDAFLQALREDYDEAYWPACARSLQVAAEWMDEASVSTIHSWCQSMLREHAFSSGSLFKQELSTDLEPFKLEATRDYWRNFYYALNAEDYQQVASCWKTPYQLYQAVRNLWSGGQYDEVPTVLDMQAVYRARDQRIAEHLKPYKAKWKLWADQLIEFIEQAEAQNKLTNKRKLSAKKARTELEPVKNWAMDEQAQELKISPTFANHLTSQGLAELYEGTVPELPGLNQLSRLQEAVKKLPGIKTDLTWHAVAWIKDRFQRQLQRQALMGFDDIIKNTRQALEGEQGQHLGEIMRAQFPVALIDEFQDTDPDQYAIFNAVYQVAENDQQTAVFLIGDPKQAIYAFRGADIYTYLQARADTAGRHFTLARNFRSTSAMVNAGNQLFLPAERRPGKKAFLFGDGDFNPVPYTEVEASGLKKRLLIDNQDASPLQLWTSQPEEDTELKGETYQQTQAESFATYITELLNLSTAGKAGILDEDQWQPLQTKDIAILVNNRFEARQMQSALRQRNIPSVYLSDSNSVYDAPVAIDLLAILHACANPGDARALMVVLSSSLLNLDISELDQLRDDDFLWDKRVEQFIELGDKWDRQGVLTMLHAVLHQFQVPQRLKAEQGGERLLTDLLHLAELLQQAASSLEGEQALIRYFTEQIYAERESHSDEQVVRLESDADLIQIVTIHKSKGLEYPLVFLPFISACRPQTAGKGVLHYHDSSGIRQSTLEPDDDALQQAEEERLGEDIRKLYVAVTRAKFACWASLAPVKNWQSSALAYLAGAQQDFVEAALSTWAESAVKVSPLPEATADSYQPVVREDLQLAHCKMPPGRVLENWWIASYSALKYGAMREPESALEANLQELELQEVELQEVELQELELQELELNEKLIDRPAAGGIHQLPRGAGPGTFLHNLLEDAAQTGFAEIAAQADSRMALIERRCRSSHWAERTELLNNWLQAYLNTEFVAGDSSLRLCDLQVYKAEPEFWFRVQGVNAVALDNLVIEQVLPGHARPGLLNNYLNGMLKGFIDLIFEYQGKYYVADYKSNYLGPDDASYTQETMRDKILNSRYDMQYVIYILALHKLLQSRLGDAYDYDEHVGGALYLFLRGHNAPSRGAFFDKPSRQLIEQLDALLTAQGEDNV
ncbi:exodeoxyribonuclease V subunit beta [Aliidiomarina minuta]|uniref:RecBCD enzyme subunit RecB n=1 Tax=Aliidiomarina minuta TaxID=880057 RepID=A0A432W5U4_9GAMM|nr:exodeoxyribonuclease V subunit beta [Aliidiomarina minuta]RUO25443.1 exodeoxyribonuclease V subunit beta [Aliidiomarina minuta]